MCGLVQIELSEKLNLAFSVCGISRSHHHRRGAVSASNLRDVLMKRNPARRSRIKESDVPETTERLLLTISKRAEKDATGYN